jgi:probable F420-dependent oxidoreductase
MHIDTLLPTEITEVTDRARELAELGFDGAFSFEGVGDVFLPLALAAQATDLTLYSNIALAFPRSAMHLAYAAWDLQKLSRGRFMLGLGTQVKANIERRFSATWSHPVERMADTVGALKAIFACWQDGQRLDHHGRFSTFTLMQPTFNPGPLAWGPPPVLVGALGPRMTQMVASVADGVLLHPFMSESFFQERTLVAVDAGLADAERAADQLSVVATAIVCTGRDAAEMAIAEAGTRALLGFYGSTPAYRPVLEQHGWGDLQTELNDLVRQGRWAEMAERIDDEVLDTLSIRVEPAGVGAAVRRRFGTRPDRIGFYLPYAIDPACMAEIRVGFD